MSAPVKILQFGATGQLAREIVKAASPSVVIQTLSRDQADFRYPDRVADAVREADAADIVLNAAAYTAVDKAESELDLARAVNARSVESLARACNAKRIPLIHLSTDYVFDGSKSEPYVETDPTNPINAYGLAKLEGEEAIRGATDRHIILRTSWVYSAHGSNFVKTMLRLGAEREELRVVDDQHGAPTSAADLARAILSIAASLAEGNNAFGTFHYANAGETTWRGFAEAIFKQAGMQTRVVPIPTREYPTPARRPLNSRLNCEKIDRVYNVERPAWPQALRHVMKQLGFEGGQKT